MRRYTSTVLLATAGLLSVPAAIAAQERNGAAVGQRGGERAAATPAALSGAALSDEASESWLPLEGQPQRVWTDDTGQRRSRASLLAIGPDRIRLLHESGRVVSTAMSRLGAADQAYVRAAERWAARQEEAAAAEAGGDAARPPAAPHTANPVRSDEPETDVLRIRVAKELLDRFVRKEFTQDRPVREVIQGTPTVGTSHTVARVEWELLPSRDRALFDVVVRGQVDSQTVSSESSVSIHSSGLTHFAKRLRVGVTCDDLDVSYSQLATSSRFLLQGITTRFRGLIHCLAVRIACRQYYASKTAADAESNSKSARHIDAAIRRLVDEMTGAFKKRQETMLDIVEQAEIVQALKLRFVTSRQALGVAISAPTRLLGAERSAPPPEATAPLVAYIHRSLARDELPERLAERLQAVVGRLLSRLPDVTLDPLQLGAVEVGRSPDDVWIVIQWDPPKNFPAAKAAAKAPANGANRPANGGERR